MNQYTINQVVFQYIYAGILPEIQEEGGGRGEIYYS